MDQLNSSPTYPVPGTTVDPFPTVGLHCQQSKEKFRKGAVGPNRSVLEKKLQKFLPSKGSKSNVDLQLPRRPTFGLFKPSSITKEAVFQFPNSIFTHGIPIILEFLLQSLGKRRLTLP